MESRRRRRIAIIGAGPAGLTAVVALRRLGIEDVAVYEQAPRLERVGAGILLHANGLRVLDALGLYEPLVPFLRLTQTLRLEAVGGKVLATLDCGRVACRLPYAAALRRYTLQDALLNAADAAGVSVRCGRTLTGLEIDNDGRARLRFAGFDAATERYDVVLACDGVRSAARDAVGGGWSAKTRALATPWLRGTVPRRTDEDAVREVWGRDGRGFGILPLPGDETHFFCTAPPESEWAAMRGDPARLRAWVEGWAAFGPDALRLLRAVPDWGAVHHGRPGMIAVAPWRVGPVFLVGDAAHALPPNMGQGANSALCDALVLARLLATGDDLAAVARRYEAVRRPHMARTGLAARQLMTLAHLSSSPLCALRDALLPPLMRLPPLAALGARITTGHNPAEEPYLSPIPPPRTPPPSEESDRTG